MKTLLTITLQFITLTILAQSPAKTLHQYFQEAKNGSYATAPKSLFDEENDFNALLSELEEYQSDSVSRIRSKAYNLSSRFGQKASEISIKQKAIHQQINALNDQDRGIAGNAIAAMSNFKSTTFTESQKSEILGLLSEESPHFDEFVKLIGILQMSRKPQNLHTSKLANLLTTKPPNSSTRQPIPSKSNKFLFINCLKA